MSFLYLLHRMVLSIIDLSSVTYPFLSSWNGHDPAVEIFGASLKLLIAEISAINGGSLRYSLFPRDHGRRTLIKFPRIPFRHYISAIALWNLMWNTTITRPSTVTKVTPGTGNRSTYFNSTSLPLCVSLLRVLTKAMTGLGIN
jgi:hypothetical protein